jgi:RHS repeat-associated protein
MFLERLDFSLPGAIDLFWERYYNTALAAGGSTTPLGTGWTCRFFATLARVGDDYVFTGQEGESESFTGAVPQVATGGLASHLGSCRELRRVADAVVLTTWDVEDGEVERYLFVPPDDGQVVPLLRYEEAIAGHALELRWNNRGQLLELRQTLEDRALVFDYGADGFLDSVSLRASGGARRQVARLEHDAGGRLVAAHDAAGQTDRYTYDDNGRMVLESLKDGGEFRFAYDAQGRCTFASGLDAYDLKIFRYLDATRWTEIVDSHGAISRYQFNASGQVVVEIDPLGGTCRRTFDDHGRLTVEAGPLPDAVRSYAYDDRGNRVAITEPGGAVARLEFNDAHQPVRSVDANGHVWQNEYNARNQIVATIDPLGLATRATYDERGLMVALTDPRGGVLRGRYSERGDLIEETDPEGNITRFEVDEFGFVSAETGPDNIRTEYSYDVLGRPTGVVHADRTRLTYVFDAGDNVVSHTDARGYTTEYRYAPCNRAIQVRDALGHRLDYTWGSEPGELLSIVNEKGEQYSFVYDAAGRAIFERGFDGRELHYRRDLAGRFVETVRGTGERTRYTWNAADCITAVEGPDGQTSRYEYDKSGNVVAAENQDIRVEITRDALGRAVLERQGPQNIERRFDSNDNVVQVSSTLGADVAFSYDQNDLLTRVIPAPGLALELRRNAVGDEVMRLLPHGGRVEQDFDPYRLLRRQRLTTAPSAVAGGLAQVLVDRGYRYDAAANLVEIEDARWGRTAYAYDPEELLVRVEEPGLRETFAYDPTANIEEHVRDGVVRRLTYAPGSRLIRADGTTYEYDNNGNLTRRIELAEDGSRREWRFRWDGEDQLREVVTPDGVRWSYRYDPFGRRISKSGPGGTTTFVWDENVLLHAVSDGAPPSTYVVDEEELSPICEVRAGKLTTFVTDHLGTPRELVDGEGQVEWAGAYDAWGRLRAAEPASVPNLFRFPGQWFDAESGLHYTRFRYYDPTRGHFISPDPIGLRGGYNLYQYGWDPINWDDPVGWIHRNSKKSRAKNHVYEIKDKNGKTWKYGISGKPLKKGKSERAESQKRKLNAKRAPSGFAKPFKTKVHAKGKTRTQALNIEQKKVNKWAKKNTPPGKKVKGPPGNKRPTAKKC